MYLMVLCPKFKCISLALHLAVGNCHPLQGTLEPHVSSYLAHLEKLEECIMVL